MGRQQLYNPALLSKKDLKNTFTIRKDTLDELINHIARHKPEEPSRHIMILGSQGMGKTTLGLRALYEIEDDPNLRSEWQPVPFMEESYGICDAADFWLLALNHLSYAVGDDTWLEYSKKITNSEASSQMLEAYALDALNEYCDDSGKRLVLFIDNINSLFEQFKSKRDVHAIRAALMKYPRLFLLGTAHSVFVEHKDYWAPFYGFYQTIRLRRIDSCQTEQLLIAKAERLGVRASDVDSSAMYGKIEAIRVLTNGNTRSISSAIQMLIEGSSDEADVLERLIDEHTPYFKAKIGELPVQARRIFNELAIGWRPMLAREVGAKARLGTSQTSAQLRILIDRNYVSEAKLDGENRARYQLQDRLFNIYYLFRMSRTERERLRCFAAFLYNYYSSPKICNPYFDALRNFSIKDCNFSQILEVQNILSVHVLIWGNIAEKKVSMAERLQHFGRYSSRVTDLNQNADDPQVWARFGGSLQRKCQFSDAFQAYGHALGLILSNSLKDFEEMGADENGSHDSITGCATNCDLVETIFHSTSEICSNTSSIHHRFLFGCLSAFIAVIGAVNGKDALAADALRHALQCAGIRKLNDQEDPESKATLLAVILGVIPMIENLGEGRILDEIIEDGVVPMIEDLRDGKELRGRIDQCTRMSKSAGRTLRGIVFIGAMSTGMRMISNGHPDRAKSFFSWMAREFSFRDVAWGLGAELAASQLGDRWYLSAGEFVDKALVIRPDDPGNHFVAFVVASKLETWGNALKHLERCLELDPGFGGGGWPEVAGLLVRAACAGESRKVGKIMENGSLKNELEPLWYALKHEENLHATPLPREIVDAVEDIRSRLSIETGEDR